MTRQLTDTAEATTESLLVLEPHVLKEGEQHALRHRHEGPGSTSPVTAQHNDILECPHYWIIEAAVDPTSKGICKMCGEEKLFRNYLRWAEVEPATGANGKRQADHSKNLPEQMGEDTAPQARRRYGRSVGLRPAARGIDRPCPPL